MSHVRHMTDVIRVSDMISKKSSLAANKISCHWCVWWYIDCVLISYSWLSL